MFALRYPLISKKFVSFQIKTLSLQFQHFSTVVQPKPRAAFIEPPNNEIIACSDCKHYHTEGATCDKFVIHSAPDYINGEVVNKHESAVACREDPKKCGPNATLFEKRPIMHIGQKMSRNIGIAFGMTLGLAVFVSLTSYLSEWMLLAPFEAQLLLPLSGVFLICLLLVNIFTIP